MVPLWPSFSLNASSVNRIPGSIGGKIFLGERERDLVGLRGFMGERVVISMSATKGELVMVVVGSSIQMFSDSCSKR